MVASFADHEVRTGLKREVGEALQAGTGVVICLVYPNGRGPMESTLYRADDFRAVRMDRTSIESLDALVAEEMAKIARESGAWAQDVPKLAWAMSAALKELDAAQQSLITYLQTRLRVQAVPSPLAVRI